MNSIKNLAELIKTLRVCDSADYVKVAGNMHLPKSDFKKYTHWKSDGYTRNCIERTEHFELTLICWKPGDESPVHSHDDQRCWVYQVDGNMTESRYKLDENETLNEYYKKELGPGSLSFMEDKMGYHALRNRSNQNAMTLHLYISPIDNCQVFNTSEERFKRKELIYDSYKGVLTQETIAR